MCHEVHRNNDPEEECKNWVSEEEKNIQIHQKQCETVFQPKALDWALTYSKKHSVTYC